MKIAITAKGPNLADEMDPRFGRAAYILIVETDSLACEAIDNTANVNAFKGAGIQAAAAICDKEASVLLTGYCGPNAFKALDRAGVKVVNDQKGPVMEAIQKFKKGMLEFASSANVDGHW
jgi:predicted Fe-Mo cluster-binding NifX family protein